MRLHAFIPAWAGLDWNCDAPHTSALYEQQSLSRKVEIFTVKQLCSVLHHPVGAQKTQPVSSTVIPLQLMPMSASLCSGAQREGA